MVRTTDDGNLYLTAVIDGKEHEVFVENEDAEMIAQIIRSDDVEAAVCSIAENHPPVYTKLAEDEVLLERVLNEINTEISKREQDIRELVILSTLFRVMHDEGNGDKKGEEVWT